MRFEGVAQAAAVRGGQRARRGAAHPPPGGAAPAYRTWAPPAPGTWPPPPAPVFAPIGPPAAIGAPAPAWPQPAMAPGPVAAAEERFAARVLDAAVGVGAVLALVLLRSLLRDVLGFPAWAADPLGPLTLPALLAAFVAYDPVTTRLLGASPGKRALGLRVVDLDGTPSGPTRLAIRSASTLALWLSCVVPGMLDGLALCCDDRRRSWHDRATATLVVRGPAGPSAHGRRGSSGRRRSGRDAEHAVVAPFVVHEPWRDLADAASQALERFDGAIGALAAGSVHDRVVSLRSRVARSVRECHDLAARGDRLAVLLGEPEGRSAALAATLQATAELEAGLRHRVAQVQDASYRAVGIAATAAIASNVDDVASELAALAAGLSEVS